MESRDRHSRKTKLGSMFRTAGASGKKIHVMSSKGRWVLFKEGANRVISKYASKDSAIFNGEKIIASNAADSLVIHNADGTVNRVQLAK